MMTRKGPCRDFAARPLEIFAIRPGQSLPKNKKERPLRNDFAGIFQPLRAMSSISTLAPRGSAATPTVVRAGWGVENCLA